MMSREIRGVNRNNFLAHVGMVRDYLASNPDDAGELIRLLWEAVHVIARQEASRRVAAIKAEQAALAARTLTMLGEA